MNRHLGQTPLSLEKFLHYPQTMGELMAGFGLFMVFALNALFWIGGWNLIAGGLLKLFPSVDLRVCQQFRQVYRDGETKSEAVHTWAQSLVFFLLVVGDLFTTYYSFALIAQAIR